MFEYTREFIINDNAGSIKINTGTTQNPVWGNVRFAAFTGNTPVTSGGDELVVERMVRLKKDNIVRVTKHVYDTPHEESVTITAPSFTETATINGTSTTIYPYRGKTIRVKIAITQDGRVISTVNDQYPNHTKTYFYEAAISNTATTWLDAFADIVKQANKEASYEGQDRLITVEGTSTTLKVEATDCYTRIQSIEILELEPCNSSCRAEALGGLLTGYQDYDEIYTWKRVYEFGTDSSKKATSFTQGTEGAGTVARILKNMRLLTAANIDPYGLNADERPVAGGQYDQYTIEYVNERRAIGHQVLGAIDHSLTTHIFFVNGAASSAFLTALTTGLGLTVTLIGNGTTPASSVAESTLPERSIAYVGDAVSVTLQAKDVDGTNPQAAVTLEGTVVGPE